MQVSIATTSRISGKRDPHVYIYVYAAFTTMHFLQRRVIEDSSSRNTAEHAGLTLSSTACGDYLGELASASQVLAWSFGAFDDTMSEATG